MTCVDACAKEHTTRSHSYTGKERDQETGLDYFGARYYGSALGRFTSPDEPFADQHPEDPQSLNLYGYVRNNPLNKTDPNGRDCFEGLSSCANYIAGGLMAIGNIPSSVINLPNRIVDAGLSLFTDKRIGDAVSPSFTPSNQDQKEGMEAANVVMMLSPLAEAGASTAAGAVGTAARVEEGVAAAQETGTIYKLPPQEGSGKPYIGRTVDLDRRMATRTDGRTGPAEGIDTFNAQDTAHGQYKEQKAINANGGVQNLDNKRNEVNPKRFEELKKKYEKQP
jgi:RHS repeat-associated protein